MCFRKSPPPPAPLPQPNPIQPRLSNERALTQSELPTKKDLLDKDDAVEVEYGAPESKAGKAAGKKRGTDALRIDLNKPVTQGPGTQTTARTGGLNV
tara:strand:- start:290 stop:580 length:291 start_codon:yes stop_codon:yes gene_type:complete